MKIVIDISQLNDISINELLHLYKIHYKKENIDVPIKDEYDVYVNLANKNYIRILKELKEGEFIDKFYLKQTAKNLINNLLNGYSTDQQVSKTQLSTRKLNTIIDENVDNFRAVWKGLKPGAMGSRDNCKAKLTRWMRNNPDRSIDDIIKAAKIYVRSLRGDYKYLQRADYFIYKKMGGEEGSRLDAFIEEIENVTFAEETWTNKLS